MMQRSFAGWCIAGVIGFGLFAPIVACEMEPAPTASFAPPSLPLPDGLAPYVPVARPDASPWDRAVADAGGDAAPPAACDDGKIDPGETCDPLASCPTTCPSVQCQLRTLEGAGTCEARCTNTTVQTACVNGDGCCPATCNSTNDDDCDAACGNTVIEEGETCDPLASCPTSCPPRGCQLRTLQGAGTCAAKCVDGKVQTACINGDGCCPLGCNANNDSDCGPGCGNNVVERGELCDPLASCPTACPPIQCQLRALQNAGTCQAQCVNAGLQTACINNDGCCPDTCNANNDNDCTAECGNGVVEKGETCDPIGACPTICPQRACQLRQLENAGTCQAACSPSGFQTTCIDNDDCCPKGCNANNDNDCKPVCGNNIVETGETCDGNCPVACTKPRYTCYRATGSSGTCDLDCHNPIQQCGVNNDSCCPFDGAGGCSATSDGDCNGGGWQWMEWPTPVDTTKGCTDIILRGIVPGGSYDITTCAPPKSKGTGTGDPQISRVMDDSQVNYAVGNDNCTDPTALPNLAKSNCMNKGGQLMMACASPSPGGFIAGSKASAFIVTLCPSTGGAGSTPLYVWYNATKPPSAK